MGEKAGGERWKGNDDLHPTLFVGPGQQNMSFTQETNPVYIFISNTCTYQSDMIIRINVPYNTVVCWKNSTQYNKEETLMQQRIYITRQKLADGTVAALNTDRLSTFFHCKTEIYNNHIAMDAIKSYITAHNPVKQLPLI